MKAFPVDAVMQSIAEKLPNATVKCPNKTPAEREIIRQELHEINQRWNHAPALGNGALKQQAIKPEEL